MGWSRAPGEVRALSWTCPGRGAGEAVGSLRFWGQDWRWCLYPSEWMRPKGGSGDREETKGPRCKPWSPMRRAQQQNVSHQRESIRQCGVVGTKRKRQAQAGEEGCSHAWRPQGTEWGAKEEGLYPTRAGVLATEDAPPGWGLPMLPGPTGLGPP